MKNILSWVKSNLLIVIFSLFILVSLPAAFVGSSMWRESILAKRKEDAEKEFKKVDSLSVNYTLPTYDPGQQAISIKSPPNSKLTEWFKTEKDRLGKASVAVVRRAEEFNQGAGVDAAKVGRKEFKPMVDGLFIGIAEPKSKDEQIAKLNEMEEVLLGKRGRPNPYQVLLDSIRAGAPADAVRLSDSLNDFSTREIEKVTAGKRPLTSEEAIALGKQLSERRLGEYQAAAKNISVYATLANLPTDHEGIPMGKIEADRIEINQFFKYQWDYWMLSDILAAVRLANSDGQGTATDIEHSVVKRIERISLEPAKGLAVRSEQDRNFNPMDAVAPAAAPAAGTAPGLVQTNKSVSITGRQSGEGNSTYDVRRATVTVVISSARINEFLDAITRTNFMSVIDLDVTAVDAWGDLKDGFYYGNENVVRADIGIETIWLRSWMLKYMPKEIQAAVKVPGVAPAEGAAVPGSANMPASASQPPAGPRGSGGGGRASVKGGRGGG